jgi:stress response protein YsnF
MEMRVGILDASTSERETLYKDIVVMDEAGLRGIIDEGRPLPASVDSRVLVRFQNGKEVYVPRRMLIHHKDGHYYLPINIEALLAEQENSGSSRLTETTSVATAGNGDGQPLVIPVIEEKIKVQKREQLSGIVEIRKTVNERTETVDEPLLTQEVEVQRVAINRFVDEAVPVRHEDDTMIIPLLEEVLVVEKRLLLREEVHVKTVRRELHNPQEITLREERVEVVRRSDQDYGLQQESA